MVKAEMSDGFMVDRSALIEAADGLNEAMAALAKLGFSEAAAEGRGFSRLAPSGLELGDASVEAAFGGFCDSWAWGVRSMVKDGNEIVARLGLNNSHYLSTDQAISQILDDVTRSLHKVVVSGRP